MAKVVDVMNLSSADMANFGGSATTVPAYSRVDGITISDAGLGTAMDTLLCCVIKSTTSYQEKNAAATMLKDTPPYKRNALAV